jgi:4-diphosphocytidyl-2-C-methyl-D-erythritol kinase
VTGEAPPRGDAAAAEVTESAPAKVNLYLHVTGRRPDGYHLLDSLIVFADLCDTVTAAPAERLSLALAGPFADALDGSDNLVLRAARALAAHAGRPPRAALRLVKHLPVAAGLGGGSSDAAAALRALVRLWDISIEEDDLARLALELGADVPVCLSGRATLVGGVGEVLTPLDLAPPPCHLVLANPRVPLSTAEVFGAFSGPAGALTPPLGPTVDRSDLIDALRVRRNDLEAPARQRAPVIASVLAALDGLPGRRLARMSGSGPTCFALFDTADAASAGAHALAAARPDWWVAAAPVIAS